MRIAACVEYDGFPFHGWQRQGHVASIQEHVETALSRVADHPVSVICAGRTDAGVHAVGQIIHFDSDAPRQMAAWVRGANSCLPREIALVWARPVDEGFHARFSALSRAYRYVIFNRSERTSILARRTAWGYRPLDVPRMQAAARHLIGEHDFSSYRAVGCQARSPVRNVMRLDVTRSNDLVFIDIQANAFLHHMVRNIAGVLMCVGAGEREPVWAREVLEHRDRALGGVTGHASGLYFMHVQYPDHFAMPGPAPSSMVW